MVRNCLIQRDAEMKGVDAQEVAQVLAVVQARGRAAAAEATVDGTTPALNA